MARDVSGIAQRGSTFRRPRRLAAFAGAHEWVIVSGMMLALSIATTWPLVREARGALPSDLGDPLLNTFILAWDADRILARPRRTVERAVLLPAHRTRWRSPSICWASPSSRRRCSG